MIPLLVESPINSIWKDFEFIDSNGTETVVNSSTFRRNRLVPEFKKKTLWTSPWNKANHNEWAKYARITSEVTLLHLIKKQKFLSLRCIYADLYWSKKEVILFAIFTTCLLARHFFRSFLGIVTWLQSCGCHTAEFQWQDEVSLQFSHPMAHTPVNEIVIGTKLYTMVVCVCEHFSNYRMNEIERIHETK